MQYSGRFFTFRLAVCAALAVLSLRAADPGESQLQPQPLRALAPRAEAGGEKLLTVNYRVNPESIAQALFNLKGVPRTENAQDAIRSFLATEGVDLSGESGPKVFYNERTGVLMVRGTQQELAGVERALMALNVTPPQVKIEVLIAEFEGESLPPELQERLRVAEYEAGKPLTFALTKGDFVTAVRALEQREGVDLLTPPNIVTLSGRQARIAMENQPGPMTDPPFTAPGKAPKAVWSR